LEKLNYLISSVVQDVVFDWKWKDIRVTVFHNVLDGDFKEILRFFLHICPGLNNPHGTA